ncbi:MAG: CotH kinase family protein [Clostridia bacterium]|nr:CotH kinase family protein [Clostridia bacterium]
MKRIRSIIALLLFAVLLFAAGCDTAVPAATDTETTAFETESLPETETETETAEPEKEDTRLSPVFSVKGGVYGTAQSLALSLPENAPDGAYIAYTTDCSEPDGNSKKYEDEIEILTDGTSVVRAECFDKDGKPLGYIKTATYIKADKGRFSTLVVSLVTEESNLHGKTGIMDNPTKSGKDWERPCHVEIILPDGLRVISQDAGLRIFGGSSRGLPQKSFRVIARRDGYYDEMKYNGNGSFDYPLFDGRKTLDGELLKRYDRFILRNGGNDSIQATAADPDMMTLTRDAAANAFMTYAAPEVASQTSRFAVVYLNGEYYGILDMKEDINDDYMYNVYGLEKDKMTVIKSELDTTRRCGEHENGSQCRFDDVWFYYEVDEGPESELEEYLAMCREAREALGKDKAALDLAYEKLSEKLDTESFMKYCAVMLYVCNTDWPHNNVRLWRYTGEKKEGNAYSDGKWRFSTRDMDFAFGRYQCLVLPEIYTQADTDTIRFTLGNFYDGAYEIKDNYPDSLYVQSLLALCLHNDGFRSEFISFCKELCSDQSVGALKSIMSGYSAQIKDEVQYHLDRWQGTISRDYTVKIWKRNIKSMEKWAEKRPAYFLSYSEQINEYFK